MKRRVFTLLMTALMVMAVVSAVPVQASAADNSTSRSSEEYKLGITTDSGVNIPAVEECRTVYICGAAGQETNTLRASQLLEVHTEGFDTDDTLTYMVRLTNSNSGATTESCYCYCYSSPSMYGVSNPTSMKCSLNSDWQSFNRYFAFYDGGQGYHTTAKVEILVHSQKLNKDYVCSYERFADASLEDDNKNANMIKLESKPETVLNLFGGWNKESGKPVANDILYAAIQAVDEPNVPAYVLSFSWIGVAPGDPLKPADNNTCVKSQPYTVSYNDNVEQKVNENNNNVEQNGYTAVRYDSITEAYKLRSLADDNNGVMGNGNAVTVGGLSYSNLNEATHHVEYAADAGRGIDTAGVVIIGSNIIVNPNGGTWTYKNQSYNSKVILAVNGSVKIGDAERIGYRFDGWDRELTNEGTVLFTARWKNVFGVVCGPETDNNGSVGLWVGIIVCSALLVTVVITRKKRDC